MGRYCILKTRARPPRREPVSDVDEPLLGEQLTAAGADWQIHAYGGTMHAFMAGRADRPEVGIQYNERSARRAWSSLVGFLAEASRD
jgi:dienelactone hydrolase